MKYMENRETAQATLRKRKMLVAMPLLIIPFLTMGFWALGGGKGTGDGKAKGPAGLNPVLPDARLQEEKWGGKLSFYEQAQRDSVKRTEWMRSDPYYHSEQTSETPAELHPIGQSAASGTPLNGAPYGGTGPEAQLMEKLAKLQQGLEPPPAAEERNGERPAAAEEKGAFSREVDRLEHLMDGMKKTSAEDPQMEQLGSVMDKILDIQHPERVRSRLQGVRATEAEAAYTLQAGPAAPTVGLLRAPGQGPETAEGGFYSGKGEGTPQNLRAAFPAVVHGSQTLTGGGVVKLRLAQDIRIGEATIPGGSFVYGRATFANERLRITVTSIRHGASLYPVALEVYDLDGMAGIHIPGTLERAVVKESADRSLQGLELSPLDPSLKAKAASAGMQAAKNLLSRKVKQVSVTLKAGYRVLLHDQKP